MLFCFHSRLKLTVLPWLEDPDEVRVVILKQDIKVMSGDAPRKLLMLATGSPGDLPDSPNTGTLALKIITETRCTARRARYHTEAVNQLNSRRGMLVVGTGNCLVGGGD